MNRRMGLIAAGTAALALLAACSGVVNQRQTISTSGGALIAAPQQQAAPAVEQQPAPAIEAPRAQQPVKAAPVEPAPEKQDAAASQTDAAQASKTTDAQASSEVSSRARSAYSQGGHQCERGGEKTASVDD